MGSAHWSTADIARHYDASAGEVVVLDAAGGIAWRGRVENVHLNLEAVLGRPPGDTQHMAVKAAAP